MTEAKQIKPVGPQAIRAPAVRRRYRLIGCAAALGVLTGGSMALGWDYWYECQKRPTVAQIQTLVNSSGPPPGSSVTEVRNWLDAHGIPNSEISLDWREWNTPTAEQAGGPAVQNSKKVWSGCYLDANVDSLFKGDIYIFFYFDGQDRLFKTVVVGWSRCC